MISIFIYILITCYFSVEFLSYEIGMPAKLKYLTDLMSISSGFLAILLIAIRKRLPIPKKYLYISLFFLIIVLGGIFVNQTDPKQVLIGARRYFKHIPILLFACVWSFSDKDVQRQLKFILYLLMLQLPVTLYQRFIKYRGLPTGDVITGTMVSSNYLSVVLICAIAVVFSYHIRNKISLKKTILIIIMLFVPTTINETKGTLVLMPLAFCIPLIVVNKISFRSMKYFLGIIIGLVVMYQVFGYMRQVTTKPERYEAVESYVKDKRKLSKYFIGDLAPREDGNVRRGTAIYFAYNGISTSIEKFFLGHGIGSVMDSKYKTRAEFEYYYQRGAEKMTLPQLLWETGALGVLTYFTILFFILHDSIIISKRCCEINPLAVGWTAVSVIIIITALLYFNIMRANVVTLAFWYPAGIIINRKYYLRTKKGNHTNEKSIDHCSTLAS